ncbi:hypothetical protein EDE04_5912 [Streptomyces sp. 2132.2]|uniref:hypothetical protein n=1 Tax=Streptomyces sp. 2132.2 TaxID=2485161 RepID=UPI000FA7045B|nr:hypothetical protein [Streptomyces sp. 2132.2]ROQ99359.1 hypothetical protein EDE04_5912 [Streptomyces sp. 2132.2]
MTAPRFGPPPYAGPPGTDGTDKPERPFSPAAFRPEESAVRDRDEERQLLYLVRIATCSSGDRTGPGFSAEGRGEYALEEVPPTGSLPILYGAPAPYGGLTDVVGELGKRLGPDSMRRLGRGIGEFMPTYVRETENRAGGRFPSLRMVS